MNTRLFSYGVDVETGDPLSEPVSLEELEEALRREVSQPILSEDYENNANFQLTDGADALDLGSTGWGILFAADEDPAVREALEPLLELRKEQATAYFPGYREFTIPARQSPDQFLGGNRIATNGLAEPEEMPYYLTIVGSPGKIDFDFQYEIDVARAVGRIHFDSPEEYASYAATVVAAEQRKQNKRAAFFAVRNGEESLTRILVEDFIGKILEKLELKKPDWTIEKILGSAATKGRFAELLRNPPSLLFLAGHGASFHHEDERQAQEQGALICSDWPGTGAVAEGSYFSALDVAEEADLAGMIVFQFGCFTAATPAQNDFRRLVRGDSWQPPPENFVAGLPKRLLGLPGGRGALAVVGHVDRTFKHAFLDDVTQMAQNQVFEHLLKRLLGGQRIGWAMECINSWHADHAVQVANLFTRLDPKERAGSNLARTWLVRNDARNYIVLGDPAVRLQIE